ncbi:MAG: LemA family protein [Alphaproteobacteria bacterium]
MIVALVSIISVVVLILLWYVFTSNNFVAKNNRAKQCSSGICVALKQRNDMLPNLVATVKSYMKHENETLTKIVELRSKAADAKTDEEQIALGNQISAMLPKLNVMVEDYPELRANESAMNLQHSIRAMEDELQAIRRTYNAAVTDFNNYVEMFPSSIIASRKGLKVMELIEIPESEKVNVNISELFK